MGWIPFINEADEEEPMEVSEVKKPDEVTSNTVEEALECDYEHECTTLYKKIENEAFEDVMKFLSTGYWPGTFFADSVTPAEQARTWVTRFDPKDNKTVRWSQLPIHLAIVVDAPLIVMKQLLAFYPQAIRCTDDQHMLPLHLALRHGSADKVLDHLLSLFPESVNAKGKNERTCVEIAKRGPNKIRGRILEIFTKYTKNKTKYSSDWYISEMAELKEELAAKNSELDDTKSRLIGFDAAKASTELHLRSKLEKLELTNKELSYTSSRKVEDVENDKLLNDFQASKQIETLEKTLLEAEQAEKRAREAEKLARADLEDLHERVSSASSPAELKTIKKDISKLKAQRIKESKKQTKMEVKALEARLSDDIKSVSDKAKKNELISLKSTVGSLRSSGERAKSFEDINSVRAGLDSVLVGMKMKEEAAKTQTDLHDLKRSLEKGLKNADESEREEILSMKKTVSSLESGPLDTKSYGELQQVKSELASLKKEVREKELLTKTKQHYDSLKTDLDSHIAESRGQTQKELADMKKTIEQISMAKLDKKADKDIIEVKKELGAIREQLDEKEEASRTRVELAILRKALEAELKDQDGKTQDELKSIRDAVQSISGKGGLENQTNEELASLKADLASVKHQIEMKEEAASTMAELETVKLTLNDQLKESDARTTKELSAMKASVEAIDPKQIVAKNKDELVSLRAEIKSVKHQLQDKEEISVLRKELLGIRNSLASTMNSEGKSQRELQTVKSAVKSLSDKELESKTKNQLEQLKAEAQLLKVEIQGREEISRNLNIARRSIDRQMSSKIVNPSLTSLKAKMEAIEARKNVCDASEVKEINNEAITIKIQALATEAENSAVTQEVLISEIKALKVKLEGEVAQAGGRSSKENINTERALAAINTDSLQDKSVTELEILLREVKELKEKGPQRKKRNPIRKALKMVGLAKKKPSAALPTNTVAPPRESNESLLGANSSKAGGKSVKPSKSADMSLLTTPSVTSGRSRKSTTSKALTAKSVQSKHEDPSETSEESVDVEVESVAKQTIIAF